MVLRVSKIGRFSKDNIMIAAIAHADRSKNRFYLMAEQQIENWKIPSIFQCFEFSFYIALNSYIVVY